ncbi:MAG: TIGR00730 family Rossman fold protein [Bacteroidota bacterium]
MQSLCVFCGSNGGKNPVYRSAAYAVGKLLAERDIELIYGAGNVGLMGTLADAALEHGGRVVGVIPQFLMEKEVGHTGLSELIVTDTMHQRKQIMSDRAEGFLAMPGGFGTLDEVCEILTWAQLGLHQDPVGLLNVEGYYTGLGGFFDHIVTEGFLSQANRNMVFMHEDVSTLLQQMDGYQPPATEKWLDNAQV